MKKFLLCSISLLYCLSVSTYTIQAKAQGEYARYFEWRETVTSEKEAIFELQDDMYISGTLRSYDDEGNAITTIHTNGHKLYISSDHSTFYAMKIIGDQDVMVEVGEGAVLELSNSTILNQGNTAIHLRDQAVLSGHDIMTSTVVGATAVRYEGDIHLDTVFLEGTYALQGNGSITADACYAKGITQAASISSIYSYFQAEETSQHIRQPFAIGYRVGSNIYPTRDVYIDAIKGSDLAQDILPAVSLNVALQPDGSSQSLSPYLNVPCEIALVNGELQLSYPSFIQDILHQNSYHYLQGFEQPDLHVNYFDKYIATVQVNDYFGYYPVIEFPPYYGAEALYVEVSRDQINWTGEAYHDYFEGNDRNTYVRYMIHPKMEPLKTYYYRYRIKGGLYDGYESDVLSLTVINSMIAVDYAMPAQKVTQDTKPTPPVEIPPDTDYGEEEIPKDPEPIVGNEGQGGGRGESDYQPSDQQEQIISKPEIKEPANAAALSDGKKHDKAAPATADDTPVLLYVILCFLASMALSPIYRRCRFISKR